MRDAGVRAAALPWSRRPGVAPSQAAFLSQIMTGNGQLHRVRVGPQADRAAADNVAAQLKRAGHDVKVLPHP